MEQDKQGQMGVNGTPNFGEPVTIGQAPMMEPANENPLGSQAVEQPMSPIGEQPMGQPTDQPAEQTVGQATEQSTEQLTETPIEQPKKERKKMKKSAKIALAMSILLMITAGVLSVIFLNLNNTEVANDNQETVTESDELDYLALKGNDLSDFDLSFLQMEGTDKNVIYSPLSIKYALAMLADGAEGGSKTQITNILGEYQPKSYINSANRSIANAMFIRDNFAEFVKDTYTDTIKTKYNAEVMLDSFDSPDNANKWVSDQTLGIINNMFDEDTLNSQIDFVLINALAIDMDWNNQLQCAPDEAANGSTVPCRGRRGYSVRYEHENYNDSIRVVDTSYNKFDEITFNGKEGVSAAEIGASVNRYDIIGELGEDYIRSTVEAAHEEWLQGEYGAEENDYPFNIDEYMAQLAENYGKISDSTDFYFYESEDEKVFAKDLKEYDGGTLQYVGIMPKNEELGTYVNELTAEKASQLIEEAKDSSDINNYKDGVVTRINAHIPFFKFDYSINNLSDDLASLGITDVFSKEKADLSSMLEINDDLSDNPHISKAIHKAEIEFSNDGIKAAAASAVGGMGAGGGGFDYTWDVPVEEIDLTFDNPYIFLIRDKASGEVWFMGAVTEL